MVYLFDAILIAVGLTFMIVVSDYLQGQFAGTHPEFLPFLRGIRRFVIVLGNFLALGYFLFVVLELVLSIP